MMNLRALAFFPLVWSAVLLLLLALTAGTSAEPGIVRVEVELAKILSLLGLWAAAFTHNKGDYLRRAWFLIGLGMVLMLVRDLTLLPLGFDASGQRWLAAVRGTLVLLGNLSSVVGIWMLAHAWKVGGIVLPGTRFARWGVVAITIALALALTGPGIVDSGRQLLSGDLEMLVNLGSTFGDMVSLVLIAPLLLTALALRGGLFTWPWAFFTTGSLFWLLFDAVDVVGADVGLHQHNRLVVGELIRALACGYIFAAGMAQRLAVLRMRRDATGG